MKSASEQRQSLPPEKSEGSVAEIEEEAKLREGVGAAVDEASISVSLMQELAKYESAEREVRRLLWIIMENESNEEKEIMKSRFEDAKANGKAFVREMLQASDKERALEVVKKERRTTDHGVQKFKLEPLRFPIGAANDKTRCYVYMKGSKDNSWNLNCSVILQSIANGEDSTHTHALEWKLCKSMKNKCSQVLDVQFGVSRKSLKMVAAYSDGYLWFFELLNPLELKNWQLQAKFQNVIDSLSTLGKPSSLPASVSWNPRKGEEQEPSFVFAFNSDSPHLNCAVTET
ncbi:unnamed protein product [Arabidopsis arenosa]|uniref:Uncharacterized protein n=1 Tax=Arabidopsis arenosa TaxID=38785 RepID=A0A8S1ZKV1_ARAAE|nr:unnamed protein product [Arabidopsis arenosa]